MILFCRYVATSTLLTHCSHARGHGNQSRCLRMPAYHPHSRRATGFRRGPGALGPAPPRLANRSGSGRDCEPGRRMAGRVGLVAGNWSQRMRMYIRSIAAAREIARCMPVHARRHWPAHGARVGQPAPVGTHLRVRSPPHARCTASTSTSAPPCPMAFGPMIRTARPITCLLSRCTAL